MYRYFTTFPCCASCAALWRGTFALNIKIRWCIPRRRGHFARERGSPTRRQFLRRDPSLSRVRHDDDVLSCPRQGLLAPTHMSTADGDAMQLYPGGSGKTRVESATRCEIPGIARNPLATHALWRSGVLPPMGSGWLTWVGRWQVSVLSYVILSDGLYS
jgi:hypothetical protein